MCGSVVIFEVKRGPRAKDLGNTAPYSISLLVFYNRGGVCLLRGTNGLFKLISGLS